MEQLHLINTIPEFEAMLCALLDQNKDDAFVAFDTETTGVEKDSEIVGMSVAWGLEEAYYVVLSHWDAENKILIRNQELWDVASALPTALLDYRLVMHNAIFDCEKVRRTWGIELIQNVHTDTQELWHLLDEENSCALKEISGRLLGVSATAEQQAMKASVMERGGIWQDKKGGIKEMYKADPSLLGYYGAKDVILTLNIFYIGAERLFDQGLDKFFYEEESMPLLRTGTYQMNTAGLKVDLPKIKQLQSDLEYECGRLTVEIQDEIAKHTKEMYPKGFGKKKGEFNMGSSSQLAWLLFIKLDNVFGTLTDGGRKIAQQYIGKVPYNIGEKKEFVRTLTKLNNPKFAPQKFMQVNKDTLMPFAVKYEWVRKLLYLKAADKLLNTYAIGIQDKVRYGVVYPSFLQHGTTSGRYSSSKPNFQNLPRKDKRIKSCIMARPGMAFVGADYSQLEPRVFASRSQDQNLMASFARGEDFYAVIGVPVFKKFECSLIKEGPTSFDKLYPRLRDDTKQFALASPYGTTANQQCKKLKGEDGKGLTKQEAQALIDAYFEEYPSVLKMMHDRHNEAVTNGVVYSLYGRPRRIPGAVRIPKIYGPRWKHGDLPYQARTLLNLAVNHSIQSSGASIVNRAAVAFCNTVAERAKTDERWAKVRLVLQVHDELVAECPIEIAEKVVQVLKFAMEETTILPGVKLVAEPKIAYNLADLK